MTFDLNILHIFAACTGTWCISLALRETRGRLVGPGQLFVAPLLALMTASLLLALIPSQLRPTDAWLSALVAGGVAGVLRGLHMQVLVDHDYSLLHLPARIDGRFVTGLLALVLLAILLDVVLPSTSILERLTNIVAANGAVLCAGFLGGRAVVVYLRHLRAPHRQLLRR